MPRLDLAHFLPLIAEASQELEDQLVRDECEQSLYTFLREAWPTFDPSPFVGGWHLEAISEHLEAVTAGQIRKLLINVRPRSGKTGLVAVAWPTWTWALMRRADRPLQGAGVRFLCGSYGANKAQEDGVTARRLIGSEWYQNLWGDRVKVCFPADQVIQTELGPMEIGEVVRNRLAIRVPSWSKTRQVVELRHVIGWHTNPGAAIVRLTFDTGLVIRCTGDHLLRISSGEWLPAYDIPLGTTFPIFADRSSYVMGDVSPGAAGPHGIDCADPDVVLLSQFSSALQADAPASSDRSGYLCTRDQSVPVPRPRTWSGGHGFKLGHVGEIGRGAIGHDPVQVPDFLPVRRFAVESPSHDLIQLDPYVVSVASQVEKGMPVWIGASFYDPAAIKTNDWSPRHSTDGGPRNSSHPAITRCLIVGEAWDAEPNLGRLVSIEVLGHVKETFCISVEGNNNLLVGDDQAIIAANCSDRDNQERYDTTAGGSRINTGIPESLGKGGMIRLLDDPHKTSEVESEVTRGNVIRGYKEIWSTRSNDPKIGAEVMIMQRQAENDLSGYWLETGGPETVHLCLPAWHESDMACRTYVRGHLFWEDPREFEGESFWPERYPPAERATDEALGDFAFSGQIQQRPVPRGGGIIRREWWRPWPPDDAVEQWINAQGQPTYPPFEFVLAYLDTAFTKKEENDWSALTKWGVFGDAAGRPRAMLAGAWHERMNFKELITKTIATCRAGKVDVLVIENKAGGSWVAEEIMREMRGGEWQIVLDTPVRDKIARVHAIVPLFVDGIVHAPFMHDAGVWRSWAETVILETEHFPKGRHDDLVDTLSGGLGYLRRNDLIKLAVEHDEDERESKLFRGNRGGVAALYEV